MHIACLLLVLLAACGGSGVSPQTARAARYDAEKTAVFDAAREAVAAKLAIADQNRDAGTFTTAWHKVSVYGSGPKPTHYHARYVITVSGQRPWQVEILGQAADWNDGTPPAAPTTNDPSWMTVHSDKLAVAIHDRLESFAARN